MVSKPFLSRCPAPMSLAELTRVTAGELPGEEGVELKRGVAGELKGSLVTSCTLKILGTASQLEAMEISYESLRNERESISLGHVSEASKDARAVLGRSISLPILLNCTMRSLASSSLLASLHHASNRGAACQTVQVELERQRFRATILAAHGLSASRSSKVEAPTTTAPAQTW